MSEDEAVKNGLNTRKMVRDMILEGRSRKEFLYFMALLWEDEEQKYLKEGLD